MKISLSSARRWGLRILASLAVLLVLGILLLGWQLRRSLPILSGELVMSSLDAPVVIERDAQGVPTIHAQNRLDAARALGFLHAQDRFFGMDLNRRVGAGEISALAGKIALEYDRWLRFFPGREIARKGLAEMNQADRALLEAYTVGVNAGLEALSGAPPEYLIPGVQIRPWKAEDCLLVGLNMYYNLQDSRGAVDEKRGLLQKAMPPAVVDYLLDRTPRPDAPLDGSVRPLPPLPASEWAQAIDTAESDSLKPALPASFSLDDPVPGSNAWAAGAPATKGGRAILANDMHLGLKVPHVWYRASVRYAAEDGSPVSVDGPTLPGLPVWIVGSNRHLAWGFTNSYTDQTDLVAIETHPDDPDRYRTAEGWQTFSVRQETIEVAFGDPAVEEIRETIWGPVREGADGQLYAVIWMGAQIPRWNMALDEISRAQTLDEALAIAHRTIVPTQNLVLADASGKVAWSLIGPLPHRGFPSGSFPLAAAAIGKGWKGIRAAEDIPVIRADDTGLIWTANQRLVGGEALAILGDGGYDDGHRASRIRDQLHRQVPLDEGRMLALQGDIKADYLTPWAELFLAALDESALAAAPTRAPYREFLASWDGTAAATSAPYLHLVEARDHLHEALAAHLARPLGIHANALSPNAGVSLDQVTLDILQVAHESLLPAGVGSAREWILTVLDETRLRIPIHTTWGDRNVLSMRHPVLGALPVFGRWFNMAPAPLSGDAKTVRVARPEFGSSQRMVVAPGHEEDGFYLQPAGPSGHFLSPFFRSGHNNWLEMRAAPFLPGPAVHTLKLTPQ